MCTRGKTSLLLTLSIFLTFWSFLPAQSQTFSLLHSFTTTEGANPEGPLVQGSDGNFYGMTNTGGANNTGTVYKVTPTGTQTTLHSFGAASGNTDGENPINGLVQGNDGNFYGMTFVGGSHYSGTIFKITPTGTLTTLHTFLGGGSTEGANPYGSLVLGTDGNFYGTTSNGGTYGDGTVFKIASDGTLKTLHSFNNTDGASPRAGLVQANDGNFYGTAYSGGANGGGTVFQITSTGTLKTIYSFPSSGSPEGYLPNTHLIQGSDGYLYGTTPEGGADGYGTVFKMTLTGTITVLHSFTGTTTDGSAPLTGLVQATDGNFYGTAYAPGTIYKITSGGTLTTLHTFTGSTTDGLYPYTDLIQASDGNLYGATETGGQNGEGTIYRLGLAPALTSLSPASTDTGGSAFTLIAKGKSFANNSVVHWGSTALTTTFVSATQLNAAVSSALIANPGKVSVSVVTPGDGASNPKTFTVLLTTLKLVSATLTRNSSTGVYTANLSLKNTGFKSAPSITITKSTLGTAATGTALPASLGSIAAGASANTSLTFPASAGSQGTAVILKVSGTFTGGTFSGALKVTLP